jgi:hypothetical protein
MEKKVRLGINIFPPVEGKSTVFEDQTIKQVIWKNFYKIKRGVNLILHPVLFYKLSSIRLYKAI